MATIGKDRPRVVGFYGKGGTPELRDGPAGGTFAAGNLIKWSSGLLIIAAADDNDVAGIAESAGASGSNAKFWPLTSDLLIEMTLLEAAAADHVSVAADRGAAYGYQVSSSVFYLDQSETTNGLFRVVAIPGTDYSQPSKGIVGDTNCRVLVVPVVTTTMF